MDKSNLTLFRSLNVRGIKTDKKRSDVFSWLKGDFRKKKRSTFKPAAINIIADTHCHLLKDRKDWTREWSSNEDNSFWSLGTSHQKGVAILINDDFRRDNPSMTVTHVDIDANGRYVKAIFEINGNKYRVIAVYAPTDPYEQIKFFKEILPPVIKDGVDDAENIWGGDWNCTQYPDLDRMFCVGKTNDLGLHDLSQLIKLFDVEDIWRRYHPEQKEFTWSGQGKLSRIDYWLTSVSLNCQIKKVSHIFAPYTDHKAVDLLLKTDAIPRGPGLWKMNSDILLNEEYKVGITNLWNKWKLKKNSYADIKRWWDLGKRHIKSYTQQFSKDLSFQNKSKLIEIEEKINELKQSDASYENLQKEYEDLFSIKSKGAKVRSRAQWWEEGEQSSKYFFGLEKRNAKEKSWDQIMDKKGNLISGTQNIQSRQVEFYEDLYKSQNLPDRESYKKFFLENRFPAKKLSEESKQNLERDIEKKEVAAAVKMTKNNKSPGPDGISFEFYKLYWDLIGDDLVQVLKCGIESEELSHSQYLATIILLYKKGFRPDIRNWRPISLLNTDYKILSKVFAERIKAILVEIIHSDQKGCVPGRYIGHNIRLIDDILYEIENQSPESVLLQMDQEKAFDRVEWAWLFDTLSHFNFGDRFIGYLKTLYKNAKSCVITNGYQSEYFNITRGIRQGDSLSALLYIIQFEPFLNYIRNDPNISGVSLKLKNCNNEIIKTKGCQYVDDNNIILDSLTSFSAPKFFSVVKKYENVSGSKVNIDKTVCLTVKEKIENPFETLKVSRGPEKVLGISLGGADRNNNEFWVNLAKKLKAKLDMWRMRSLSFEGKALIIRSLAISKINSALEMTTVDAAIIKQINDYIFDFLWSGKNIKINKEICYLPRHMAGLNIVNINALVKAKRVQWIIRALKDDKGETWSRLIENYLRCLDNDFEIEFFALKVTDSSYLTHSKQIPRFYKECIDNFQELRRISLSNNDKSNIIWCNDEHRFNGIPFFFKHWSKSGFKVLSDLYDENGNILHDHGIRDQLIRRAGFIFEMAQIKKSYPNQMSMHDTVTKRDNTLNGDKKFLLNQMYSVPAIDDKPLTELSSKDLYNIFRMHKPQDIKTKQYWCDEFGLNDIAWETWIEVNLINKLLPRKSRDFNWKILHRLVNSGTKLKLMNLSDGICKRCQNQQMENLEHLLFNCIESSKLWHVIQDSMQEYLGTPFIVEKMQALTGIWQTDVTINSLVLNMVLSLTRHHMWKIRCKKWYGNENTSLTLSLCILKNSLLEHTRILITSKTTETNLVPYLIKLESILVKIETSSFN